jgi:hypothetical protein
MRIRIIQPTVPQVVVEQRVARLESVQFAGGLRVAVRPLDDDPPELDPLLPEDLSDPLDPRDCVAVDPPPLLLRPALPLAVASGPG